MSHELHLHKIGPIKDCRLTLDDFNRAAGEWQKHSSKSGLLLSVGQAGYSQYYDAGWTKGGYRRKLFSVAHRPEAANEGQIFTALRNIVGHAI